MVLRAGVSELERGFKIQLDCAAYLCVKVISDGIANISWKCLWVELELAVLSNGHNVIRGAGNGRQQGRG